MAVFPCLEKGLACQRGPVNIYSSIPFYSFIPFSKPKPTLWAPAPQDWQLPGLGGGLVLPLAQPDSLQNAFRAGNAEVSVQ